LSYFNWIRKRIQNTRLFQLPLQVRHHHAGTTSAAVQIVTAPVVGSDDWLDLFGARGQTWEV